MSRVWKVAVSALAAIAMFGCHKSKGTLDSLLLKGVEEDNIESAKSALDEGASPNAIDNSTSIPFSALELALHNPKMVDLLLRKGASVKTSPSGIPAVVYAASDGSPEVLRSLVEHGGSLSETDSKGSTALQAAVLAGKVDNVKELLRLGANPNAKDAYGMTALHLLASAPLRPSKEIVRQIVSSLLAAGAAPAQRDNRGRTAKDLARTAKPPFRDFLNALASR